MPIFCSLPKGSATRAGISAGMAMTSERILLGNHPDVEPQAVLGEWDYRRTSNPDSPRLNRTQKLYGFKRTYGDGYVERHCAPRVISL